VPPCRHLGASDMCDHLRNIEDAAKNNGETSLIAPLVAKCFSEFEIIRDFLNSEIAKIS
jgi:hypothetical protein